MFQKEHKHTIESEAEKVNTGAAETGEGSGEKKKGMICCELEMSVLA